MSCTTLRARWASVAIFLTANLLAAGASLANLPTASGQDTVYVYQGGWSPYIYKTTYSDVTKFNDADTLPAVATTSGGTLNLVVPTSAGASASGTTSVNLDRPIFAPVTPADANSPVKDRVVSDTGLTLSGSGSTTSGGTLQPSGTLSLPIDVSTETMTGGLVKVGSGTLTLSDSNTYSGSVTINSGTLNIAGTNAYTPITLTSGTMCVNNNTTIAASSNLVYIRAVDLTGTSVYSVINGNGSTLVLGNTTSIGTITSWLTAVGAGTLTLSGGQLATTGSIMAVSGATDNFTSASDASVVTAGTLSIPTLTAVNSGTVTLASSPSSATVSLVGTGASSIAILSGNSQTDSAAELPVPEPATWLLLIASCICLALARRRFFA